MRRDNMHNISIKDLEIECSLMGIGKLPIDQ